MGGTCSRQGGQRGPFCDLKLELPLQMLIGVKGRRAEGTARGNPLEFHGKVTEAWSWRPGVLVQSELLLRKVILVVGAGPSLVGKRWEAGDLSAKMG